MKAYLENRMNFQQLSFATLLFCFSITSQLASQNNNANQRTLQHDIATCSDPCCTICCPPKDFCAKCAQLWPTCGPDRIVTPGAGPCVQNGCDLFLTADFIYWAISQDKMGFALLSNPIMNASTEESTRGKIFHPDWKMESGFKVGLGWLTCMDGWDLFAEYTWLRPDHTNKNVKPSDALTTGFTVSPLASWTADIDGLTANIDGSWKMDLNIFALELGRNFYISKCLYLRPHFGLSGAIFKQKFSVIAFADPESAEITNTSDYKIDWGGIGTRCGLDSSWHFTKCFSLYGDMAASILWGCFESCRQDILGSLDSINPAISYYVKNDVRANKPVLEMGIGVRFENWYCCDTYYFNLQIGWEMQWWRGQNQYFSPLTETHLGNLSLQGLTIQLRFQF